MKVTFQNLGPIREVTVDLAKKLTVLVGKNNTGKTMLATALYAVHDGRTQQTERAALLRPLVERAVRDHGGLIPLDELQAQASTYAEAWSRDLTASLARSLGVRKTLGATCTVEGVDFARPGLSELTVDRELDVRFSEQGLEIRALRDADGVRQPVPSDWPVTDSALRAALWVIRESTSRSVHPVERLAAPTFAAELQSRRFAMSEAILEGAGTSAEGTAYAWPIRDAIGRQLLTTRYESPLADALDAMVGGAVHVTESGELALRMGDGKTLSTPELSSTVKALSSLALALRRLPVGAPIEPLFIIDEPELSLHADLQSRFARWVGKACGAGVRFVLATHSDYIVRELSHLVMLHGASPRLRALAEEHGYDVADALDPRDVQVIQLVPGAEGVEARVLEVDRFGFRVDTIDQELRRLARVSQDLHAALDAERDEERDEEADGEEPPR